MTGKWEKAGHYACDAGGMVTQIKDTIAKKSFIITFKFITNCKKKLDFDNEPLRHLTKSCDNKACRVLK